MAPHAAFIQPHPSAAPGVAPAQPPATLRYLLGLEFFGIAWRDEALGFHIYILWLRGSLGTHGPVLHLQEGKDLLHLGLVGAVGHRSALGGQNTGSHPPSVLILLKHRPWFVLFFPPDWTSSSHSWILNFLRNPVP